MYYLYFKAYLSIKYFALPNIFLKPVFQVYRTVLDIRVALWPISMPCSKKSSPETLAFFSPKQFKSIPKVSPACSNRCPIFRNQVKRLSKHRQYLVVLLVLCPWWQTVECAEIEQFCKMFVTKNNLKADWRYTTSIFVHVSILRPIFNPKCYGLHRKLAKQNPGI